MVQCILKIITFFGYCRGLLWTLGFVHEIIVCYPIIPTFSSRSNNFGCRHQLLWTFRGISVTNRFYSDYFSCFGLLQASWFRLSSLPSLAAYNCISCRSTYSFLGIQKDEFHLFVRITTSCRWPRSRFVLSNTTLRSRYFFSRLGFVSRVAWFLSGLRHDPVLEPLYLRYLIYRGPTILSGYLLFYRALSLDVTRYTDAFRIYTLIV